MNKQKDDKEQSLFINFMEKMQTKYKCEKKSMKKEWSEQQHFYKKNGLNCQSDIKLIKNLINHNGQFNERQIRSARIIKYRLKHEVQDFYISDMQLGQKIQNYIQKEIYSILQHQRHYQPPNRYFSYSDLSFDDCNRGGNKIGQDLSIGKWIGIDDGQRCACCSMRGHKLKDCRLMKETVCEKGENSEKVDKIDLGYGICDIDY